MPNYAIIIVTHGRGVTTDRRTYSSKATARASIPHAASQAFPEMRTKKSGPDAVLVLDGDRVLATVAVERAEG